MPDEVQTSSDNENIINTEVISPIFDESDSFGLQLWVLNSKKGSTLTQRLVYGWVVRNVHIDNKWHVAENNKSEKINDIKYQIVTININLARDKMEAVLAALVKGESISTISGQFMLELSEKALDFQGFTLDNDLTFRPPSNLVARNHMHQRDSAGLKSPYSEAGVISCGFYSLSAISIFEVQGFFSRQLASYIAACVNKETSLDVLGKDVERIGMLEVFNSHELDCLGREKVKVDCKGDRVTIDYIAEEGESWKKLQFVVALYLDNVKVRTYTKAVAFEKSGQQVCLQVNIPYDGFGLEVYGDTLNEDALVTPIVHWRRNMIRVCNIGSGIVSNRYKLQHDYLKKMPTAKKEQERVERASSFTKVERFAPSVIGELEGQWRSASEQLKSTIDTAFPKQSGALFLDKLTDNKNARLELVEWLKALFEQYNGHDFEIFDPYWDGSASVFLSAYLPKGANLTVYTDDGKDRREKRIRGFERYNTLVQWLQSGAHYTVKFVKRFTPKRSAVHDRYLLITDKKTKDVCAGFNLSNSLQMANVNYPLLITPIPADVLTSVDTYRQILIRPEGTEVILDSAVIETGADEVPSILPQPFSSLDEVYTCIEKCLDDDLDYRMQRIGECLYHTTDELFHVESITFSKTVETKLKEFLQNRADKPMNQIDATNQLLMLSEIESDLPSLLTSYKYFEEMQTRPYVKSKAVEPADYFALKLLARGAPLTLVAMVDNWIKDWVVDNESKVADYRLACVFVTQGLNQLYRAQCYDKEKFDASTLLSSKRPLLKWFAFCHVSTLLSEKSIEVREIHSLLEEPDKVKFVAWKLANSNPSDENSQEEWFGSLLDHLVNEILPEKLNQKQLTTLFVAFGVNLGRINSWLVNQLIFPLLKDDRVKIDDLATIWLDEQCRLWDSFDANNRHSHVALNVTGIFVQLVVHSSDKVQRRLLSEVEKQLQPLSRTIRKNLSRQISYKSWFIALDLVLWLYGVVNWTAELMTDNQPLKTEFLALKDEIKQLLDYERESKWQDRLDRSGQFPGVIVFYKDFKSIESLLITKGLLVEL